MHYLLDDEIEQVSAFQGALDKVNEITNRSKYAITSYEFKNEKRSFGYSGLSLGRITGKKTIARSSIAKKAF